MHPQAFHFLILRQNLTKLPGWVLNSWSSRLTISSCYRSAPKLQAQLYCSVTQDTLSQTRLHPRHHRSVSCHKHLAQHILAPVWNSQGLGSPLGAASLPHLHSELEEQPVVQAELRTAVHSAIQRPLTGKAIDVVREAGGFTQDFDALCRDRIAEQWSHGQELLSPRSEGG